METNNEKVITDADISTALDRKLWVLQCELAALDMKRAKILGSILAIRDAREELFGSTKC
jgi:hypothetical protein